MMKKIVIATKNAGKLREMRAAFAHLPVEVLSLADFGELKDAVEDGVTFFENARKKAHFFCGETGLSCIADDSGLEVAALGGAPGVHSARFCGRHGDDAANNAKLVAELKARGLSASPADYRCALVFEDVDGSILEASGRFDGEVRTVPRGTGGFGYDPYFYVEGRSVAEMSFAAKDAISHRGKALRALVKKLEDYLENQRER